MSFWLQGEVEFETLYIRKLRADKFAKINETNITNINTLLKIETKRTESSKVVFFKDNFDIRYDISKI